MSHSSGPAHRSVSNIRPSINSQSGSGAPSTPHTHIRQLSNSFGSPSTLRAEEECIVIEIGCRYVKVGFAGDAGPKAVVNFGPEEQRRAGDFRRWQPGYDKAWRERIHGKKWGEAHELWKLDLRDVDLGLVGDKIERAVRDAYTKFVEAIQVRRGMLLIMASQISTDRFQAEKSDFGTPVYFTIASSLYNFRYDVYKFSISEYLFTCYTSTHDGSCRSTSRYDCRYWLVRNYSNWNI